MKKEILFIILIIVVIFLFVNKPKKKNILLPEQPDYIAPYTPPENFNLT